MNNSANILSHEDRFSLVTLPDSWAGKATGNIRVLSTGNTEEYYLSTFKKKPDMTSKEFLMIGMDNYLNSGVRHCLASHESIRLKVIKNLKKNEIPSVSGEVDVLIVTENIDFNAGCILQMISSLRELNSRTKVMIVSHGSYNFFNTLAENWKGIWNVSSTDSMSVFEDTLNALMNGDEIFAPPLESLFTCRQWQTLNLLSQGIGVTKAAAMMGISVKTVSLHKKLALAKMEAENKVYQAYVINAVNNNCTRAQL